MELTYAVISIDKFNAIIIPEVWSLSDFTDVTVEDKKYKAVFSPSHYFEDVAFKNQFDFVFTNEEGFENWIENGTPYEPIWQEIEL